MEVKYSMENINNSIDTNKTHISNVLLRVILHIAVYVILIVAVIFVANKAYDFTYQIYGNVTVSSEATVTKEIDVKQGMSNLAIARTLENEGLIVNKYSFFIRLKLADKPVQIQKCKISNNMTYETIIDKLCSVEQDDE